jgi:hypothetical protein
MQYGECRSCSVGKQRISLSPGKGEFRSQELQKLQNGQGANLATGEERKELRSQELQNS